jgi:hypothetical protein
VQSKLEWHLEILYEFTMKTRTSEALFNNFLEKFEKSNLKTSHDTIEKMKWLVNFIKQSQYVSLFILSNMIFQHDVIFFYCSDQLVTSIKET